MFCGPAVFGWHGWFGFPFGWLFLGLLVWGLVSLLRRNKTANGPMAHCAGCSRTIDPHWQYCPLCGKDTGSMHNQR